MKTLYLSLLFICIGLNMFAQKANKIVVHVEAGVKYDVKSNDYADDDGFSGVQFFVSELYPMNENFAAGLGTGVNLYTRFDEYFDKITSIPLYANAIYKLPTSGDFIPFVDLKLGYGIVSRDYIITRILETFPEQRKELNVKNYGGIYLSPSVGVLFPLNKTAISLSLSYDLQRMKAKLTDLSGERISEESKTYANTLTLRIGYIF